MLFRSQGYALAVLADLIMIEISKRLWRSKGMKKTTLAVSVAAALGMSTANAAVTTFASGTFTMYDATGAVVGGANTVTGSLDSTGLLAGSNLTSPTPFFAQLWTAHDSTCGAGGVGDIVCDMPFDWSVNTNIPVVVHFDTTTTPLVWDGTLDGDADGIPGTAMTAGPFAGFSPTFTLTAVPIPAAVWLFGSGLLGLVGVARRRRKA